MKQFLSNIMVSFFYSRDQKRRSKVQQLIVSTPPHLKTKRTTKHIMIDVCIALLPAAIMGIVLFGLNALFVVLIAVASAVLTEYVYAIVEKQAWKNPAYFGKFWKQFDFTSVVTGLLLAMVMPASVPLYFPVLGSIFAIAVVKMLFGGTGKNIVNPAIAGRIFLFISFAAMTVYPVAKDFGLINVIPPVENDITTGATPLTAILAGSTVKFTQGMLLNWLFGFGMGGCIGEVCKIGLILGYVYLVARKVIKFWQPLLYIAVCGLMTVCLNGFNFALFLPSILTGGLLLGAIFMATDYVTSPKSNLGNIIYYVALGLITAGLRQATGIEVVSFAIMLMNIVVPLIDRFIPCRPFGTKKVKEAK